MTANIAWRTPPELISEANSIRAARRIRGTAQWRKMADATNWLLGKGSSLIVGGPPGAGAIAPGTSKTLHYYVWPHEQNFVRLWCISLMAGEATDTVDLAGLTFGTVEVPSGAAVQTWTIPSGALTFQPINFRFVQIIDPPSGTAGGISIDVNSHAASNNDAFVTGVCCYEIARSVFDSFGLVSAIEETSCNTQQPIYAEANAEVSMRAVALGAQNALAQARRAKLFDWCNQAGFSPPQQTSFTGASNVFPADPFVMARHISSGVNDREVAVAVRAATTDTAQVRLKSSATTDTVTFTFSSSTPAWQTGVLNIATEDVPNLATNAGIRGGTRDRLIVETTNPVETTLTLYGIAVAETN